MTTWDPANAGTALTFANGNLDISVTGSDVFGIAFSTVPTAYSTGKIYAEVTLIGTSANNPAIGIGTTGPTVNQWPGSNTGTLSGDNEGWFLNDGSVWQTGAQIGGLTWPIATGGDVCGIAVDLTVGLGAISWSVNKNGGALSTPTTFNGAGGTPPGTPVMLLGFPRDSTMTMRVNFGATAFANAIPAGYGRWDALAAGGGAAHMIPMGMFGVAPVGAPALIGGAALKLARALKTNAMQSRRKVLMPW